MITYRVETTIAKNKTISIKNLPFSIGDEVEVFVRGRKYKQKYPQRYPLHGQPIRYTNPFGSVAEGEWGILQ